MAQEHVQEVTLPEPPPGSIADLFREALPGVELRAEQTAIDVALGVRREDFPRVMRTAKEDERLAFDFLRSLSGVDHMTHLEAVYHLYSYRLGHSLAIKVQCPYDDPHVPTVSHFWQTANWHERETHELFGIVFDGHPDLRPLLTEEGLGYYILRKSHPLAEIEDWQEDYLLAIEQARAQMAAAAAGEAAPAAPSDERAARVALAQEKAAFIKQVREEARAKGLSPEEEKAAIQAALKRFEEEQATAAAAPAPTAPPPAPAKPVDERAAKIALAQKKAALIKKSRDEARAKGLSPEEERLAVAEALKAVAAEERGG